MTGKEAHVVAGFEFRTLILERERILSVLEVLIPLLTHSWGDEVLGQHGGVSNIPWEQHWQPQRFPLVALTNHLVGEEARSDFKVSEYDYFLSDVDQRDMIHLCHEADIHFRFSDADLRDHVIDVLVAQGILLDEGRA